MVKHTTRLCNYHAYVVTLDNGAEILVNSRCEEIAYIAPNGVLYRLLYRKMTDTDARHFNAFCGLHRADYEKLPLYEYEIIW